jgi:hypothetical protein
MRINECFPGRQRQTETGRPLYMTGREILRTVNTDRAHVPRFLGITHEVRGESVTRDVACGTFRLQRYHVTYDEHRPRRGGFVSVQSWIWMLLTSGQLKVVDGGLFEPDDA